jgi:putative sterol carrier protein
MNKTKIFPTEGKIESIYQKNSEGFIVESEKGFSFSLKLKHKSIVSLIEVHSITANKIIF